MREELQRVFDVNRAHLIKGLETVHSSLLSELLAEGVITSEQEDSIKVIPESNKRNDKLCDILKKRRDSDFDKFWNILWKDQEDLVFRCIPNFQPKGSANIASNTANHVPTENRGDMSSNTAEAVASKSQESTEEKGLTNEVIKFRVQKHYADIQPSLDPKGHVVNKLFSGGILTAAELKKINEIDTNEGRCDALFEILREKPDKVNPYIGLRDALKKDFGYLVHVIDEIAQLDATPNERIGSKVKEIYEKMQPSLDPKGHILNKLYGAGVLTGAELKSLNSLKEKHDKTDQLYAILVDKPTTTNAFVHFREALEKDYSWVVEMIDE